MKKYEDTEEYLCVYVSSHGEGSRGYMSMMKRGCCLRGSLDNEHISTTGDSIYPQGTAITQAEIR